MEAFHSFWSEPGRCRNQGQVRFPDYEQLTAILSAAEWQKHSGRIRMITDTEGAQYFQTIGLSSFWDEIDVSLDDLKETVDPFLFWAAGKLYALQKMPAPCVMLDTDLIIWRSVEDRLRGTDILAAHAEALNPEVYPDRSVFRLKNGYQFPEEWDFSLEAANTAFLYLRDNEFKKYYTGEAIRFFRNVGTEGLNPVTAMCFAEQRVLPMCAAAKGRSLSFLMDLYSVDEQDLVTHNWGFKQILEEQPQARREFCMRCVRRLMLEFPDKGERLASCRDLKQYYEDYVTVLGQ